jgi:hypothetical protein
MAGLLSVQVDVGFADRSVAGCYAKDEIAVGFLAREIELDKRSAKASNTFVSVIVKDSRLMISADRSASGEITNTLKVLSDTSPGFYFPGEAQVLI